jgi:hypothetical protein
VPGGGFALPGLLFLTTLAVFLPIPPRCLFLFTYPRAMLNANSFNGFMIDVGIKEKQRQTA